MCGSLRYGRLADTGAYELNGQKSFVQLFLPEPLSYGMRRISFQFTTLDKNGLIFLGMDPPFVPEGSIGFDPTPANFYALQLEDGYLVSLFDFGGGFVKEKHESVGRVNDGVVHNVTLKGKGFYRLWVDTDTTGPRVADFTLNRRPKFKVWKVFIGGLPMRGYSPHRLEFHTFNNTKYKFV